MDLEKAYDRVDRQAVWEVLMMYGVGGKILGAVKSKNEESMVCIRIGRRLGRKFRVDVGLRQGCVILKEFGKTPLVLSSNATEEAVVVIKTT
jgi:hypothetical protein